MQGNLTSDVYMEQPETFVRKNKEDKVCKLLKPLYGLKQSGRDWYQTLNDFIIRKGGKRMESDPCVYVFNEKEEQVILIIYVDDLILASRKIKEINHVKALLQAKFEATDLDPVTDILGINVEREGLTESIRLSQKKYITELLEKFSMTEAAPVSTPIEASIKISKEMCPSTETERDAMLRKPYQELVGSLTYLANATHPDIVRGLFK